MRRNRSALTVAVLVLAVASLTAVQALAQTYYEPPPMQPAPPPAVAPAAPAPQGYPPPATYPQYVQPAPQQAPATQPPAYKPYPQQQYAPPPQQPQYAPPPQGAVPQQVQPQQSYRPYPQQQGQAGQYAPPPSQQQYAPAQPGAVPPQGYRSPQPVQQQPIQPPPAIPSPEKVRQAEVTPPPAPPVQQPASAGTPPTAAAVPVKEEAPKLAFNLKLVPFSFSNYMTLNKGTKTNPYAVGSGFDAVYTPKLALGIYVHQFAVRLLFEYLYGTSTFSVPGSADVTYSCNMLTIGGEFAYYFKEIAKNNFAMYVIARATKTILVLDEQFGANYNPMGAPFTFGAGFGGEYFFSSNMSVGLELGLSAMYFQTDDGQGSVTTNWSLTVPYGMFTLNGYFY